MNERTKRQQRRLAKKQIGETLKFGAIAIVGMGLFLFTASLLGGAFDSKIDRQNTMLCNSAKESGNREYFIKCSKFYNTGDIKYMREDFR